MVPYGSSLVVKAEAFSAECEQCVPDGNAFTVKQMFSSCERSTNSPVPLSAAGCDCVRADRNREVWVSVSAIT